MCLRIHLPVFVDNLHGTSSSSRLCCSVVNHAREHVNITDYTEHFRVYTDLGNQGATNVRYIHTYIYTYAGCCHDQCWAFAQVHPNYLLHVIRVHLSTLFQKKVKSTCVLCYLELTCVFPVAEAPSTSNISPHNIPPHKKLTKLHKQ